MYIKLFGAVFAIAACLMAGNSYYISKRVHCRSLDAMCLMLRLMRSELSTLGADLRCVLESIAPRLETPASDFALLLSQSMDMLGQQSFEKLWTDCAATCLTALEGEELWALGELGAVLGRYELSQQLCALDACAERLCSMQEKAQSQLTAQRKLSLGLPAAFGIMLVIVLI